MSSGSLLPIFEIPYFFHRQRQEVQGIVTTIGRNVEEVYQTRRLESSVQLSELQISHKLQGVISQKAFLHFLFVDALDLRIHFFYSCTLY